MTNFVEKEKTGRFYEFPTYTKELGQRLKTVIELAGGLKESSRIIGVTDEQVGKWRDGKSKAPFYAMAAFCSVTGVSLDWLATGEGPMMQADRLQRALRDGFDESKLEAAIQVVEEDLQARGDTATPREKKVLISVVYKALISQG